MSGFLRRLAARAMGIADPVRTAASLPFAGAPSLVEESLPVAADAAPLAKASGADVERKPAVFPSVYPIAEPLAGHPSGHTAMREEPAIGKKAEQSTDRGQDTTVVAKTKGISSNAPTVEPLPLLPARREVGALRSFAPDRETDAKDSEGTGFETLTRSGPMSIPTGPNELLLPPLARRSITIGLFEREGHRPERRPAGSRAATVEETTEVQVNIGRIEVTAVHEAPVAKPAPRRRNAPMSLDQYLARRQGGRS
jgi:hypothetical protein